LTQRTAFGIIDDHRCPRDGLKRYPMQTDCAAERANGGNTSKTTNHAAEPSESIDIRQSLEQRLFINVVTLCLLREIHSLVPRFRYPGDKTNSSFPYSARDASQGAHSPRSHRQRR